MALAAWSLGLVSCFVEVWSLKLVAIDFNSRPVSRPGIAHDLELERNRRQLLRRRVTNFYCEFFH